MSFASEIKKELTAMEIADCCKYAELAALVRMNGAISLSRQKYTLDVQTENAAIARRIYTLIKAIYDIRVELLVRRKMKLKKNNVYIVRLNEGVKPILVDLHILQEPMTFTRTISETFMHKSCCKKAYLRGAFLAGGSINNPETSSYHLEIFNFYEEHNDSLCDLLNQFELRARKLARKNGYIVYIKEAEKITEFLGIIGAHNALFKFEDVRIVRDMRNSVNRIVNCETANLNKTIGAAFRQIENIQFIERTVGLDQLPEKLREIAILRVKHQEVSLKELGELVESGKISKSGVNHRLKKIDAFAEKIKNGEFVP
ncbi:putative sporulation transcription regulator WhiA [Virgibacillus pantothenticus]|uniref:Probable cell division protein WhiA n=1 Tax=Virgibacillus pantothenticus TaxID=1473 RepID=A0A0L0QMF1_VIRPA|nr:MULTISPECIES: DNA-binding protein WhiA [Virgibacillus]API93478.1 DNA-binding protein WhiA [Virgibacillus sp. 6R]KNE19795.1 sporulation regulator WhiA [Virgibacillus pantothenticus]MBS7430136.1 DNA-binding protein WhiA [Virgibacillus sp. 19R1-5]MBU8566306.1 DNA-binding protein WhiA [Virgibacillus pantothenticus]MBU8600729.1 DNA-binding protein WhiA [Virgibacillus pantothenticus]